MAITDVDNLEVEEGRSGTKILAVGELPAALRQAVQQSPQRWALCSDPEAAVMWLNENPDGCAQLWLCATRPGQLSQNEVDKICEQWPLLPIIHIAGDWCEGELRSGWPLVGVQRRLLIEVLDEIRGAPRATSEPSGWLPRTQQSFEQWLDPPLSPAGKSRHVWVLSEWQETWQGIRDGLESQGHQVVRWTTEESRNSDQRDALIVDFGRGLMPPIPDIAAETRAQFATRIAILGFPRQQDIERLRQAGYSEVIAKPYRLETLLAAIQDDGL